jgi:hypothetical protein
MSWVDTRTAMDVRGAGMPAGAARLKRRRRSSACMPVGNLSEESSEESQLLSGKEMFQVIKRLSREKAVTEEKMRLPVVGRGTRPAFPLW